MILSAAEKKNRAIYKRRKIAIIAIAVLVAVLSVALVFILDYAKTSTFVDPADGTQHTVEFLTGHTIAKQVDILVLDTTFLKVSLSFFCIKALTVSKNLNIQ